MLASIREFCRAIAPEAASLEVVTFEQFRRHAPALYSAGEPRPVETLGIFHPGMAAALKIDTPVFAVDPLAIEAAAIDRRERRETEADALKRTAAEVAAHELAHLLSHDPPYHGTCTPASLGHSPQWARLVFALCIRARPHIALDPVAIVAEQCSIPRAKLWETFRPSLTSWGGRGHIETLKAMPLPGSIAPPARPSPEADLETQQRRAIEQERREREASQREYRRRLEAEKKAVEDAEELKWQRQLEFQAQYERDMETAREFRNSPPPRRTARRRSRGALPMLSH